MLKLGYLPKIWDNQLSQIFASYPLVADPFEIFEIGGAMVQKAVMAITNISYQ